MPPRPATLARLTHLFESSKMGRPYGEDISIRDHMLQCAESAAVRGLGDAMVAAALLHDIGWGMDADAIGHGEAAADFLQPLFGLVVAEPIRLHVAAKRYLVATLPGYEARLSTYSRETLAQQGGRFTSEECTAFAALPGLEAALALRRLDDAGKQRRSAESRFADYLPVLHRLRVSNSGE